MFLLAYRIARPLFMEARMEIKVKFWIEKKGEVVLGSGKSALLLAMDRLGSIQQAADEFGMSYRHAWGVIKKIEQRLGFKIVDVKLGGRNGGGTRLTPKGKVFVEKMVFFLDDLQTMAELKFKRILQKRPSR